MQYILQQFLEHLDPRHIVLGKNNGFSMGGPEHNETVPRKI